MSAHIVDNLRSLFTKYTLLLCPLNFPLALTSFKILQEMPVVNFKASFPPILSLTRDNDRYLFKENNQRKHLNCLQEKEHHR